VSPTGEPPRGPDPYKTLQVDPEADPEVIQAAYRRLARKYHPDTAPGPEAAERMTAINRAWELLGDPARRAAYDASRDRLGTGHVPGAGYVPGAGADPGRGSDRGRGAETAPRSPAADRPAPPQSGVEGPSVAPQPPYETVSRDWTSGRSATGSGYDPATMSRQQGEGSAGPPPGRPSGSVLNFGRYAGWSIGEIGRTDLDYLEWLDRAPIGRPYREEIDAILRRADRRRSAQAEAAHRQGLFRRR
jgi:DnaJ domain